jgi:hypothetical protein
VVNSTEVLALEKLCIRNHVRQISPVRSTANGHSEDVYPPAHSVLLQLGEFHLGLLDRQDVAIRVFPQREEILVGRC